MAKTILIFVFSISICITCYADQWIDPEFDEMIDSSVAIVLGTIKTGGTEAAEVLIQKVFKGNIENSIIYVSGFSGRLGPIDTLMAGELYYFFFESTPSADYTHLIKRMVLNSDKDTLLAEKIDSSNLYFVWTPTSGDILCDKEGVHADLVFNRSYKGYNDPISQENFDQLLTNRISNKTNKAFRDKTFYEFKISYSENRFPETLQFFSLLTLIKSSIYNDIIHEAVQDTFPLMRYLAAKYLANVKKEVSTELLIELVDDDDPLVQAEAVKQLKFHDPKIAGPILMEKLEKVNKEKFYLSGDIMDPVVNSYGDAFTEILWAFAYMKYKPALKQMLLMLETKDKYFFRELIEILDSLEHGCYTDYYIDYLKSKQSSNGKLFYIISDIAEKKIVVCKYPLMNFISEIDKKHYFHDTGVEDYIFSVDNGLGAFWDEEVKEFMLNQYYSILDSFNINSELQREWVTSLIEVFEEKQILEVKGSVYEFMNLKSVTESEEDLLSMYRQISIAYDSLINIVNTNLKFEHYTDSELMIKLKNEKFLISYQCYLDLIKYGLSDFYFSKPCEMLSDTTLTKFQDLTKDLGMTEQSLKISSLGCFFNIQDPSEIYEDDKNEENLFYTGLYYYIANPDKENFLKVFQKFNDSAGEYDGNFIRELIEIGKKYYPE